jgi:hypothetical protein
MTHVEQPLGLLFSYFPTESLRQLAQALQDNRVISRTYQDARGNGCLLWQLDHNIDSRDMRIRTFGFDPQLLKASEEVVRAWDLGVLSPVTVKATLRRLLVQRERFERERAARRGEACAV